MSASAGSVTTTRQLAERRRVARLLDRCDWSLPASPDVAERIWCSLAHLERQVGAQARVRDTPTGRVALRLALFRIHWPEPPRMDQIFAFREDLHWLVSHDLPRLRNALSPTTKGRS